MNVLFFTKYTEKGASSRMRSYQYIPYLQENGLKIKTSPLFPNSYLEQLYDKKRISIPLVMKSYFRRIIMLTKISQYDRIIIEKELLPYLPAWGEKLLKLSGKKYIVDYDDAIFHNYDNSSNPILRFFLKDKIKKVMRYSDLVIAGNHYLSEYAKRSGAKRVEILPTPIDITRYEVKKQYHKEFPIIGWIGTLTTFKYLSKLKDAFNYLIKKYNIKVHIVGTEESLQLIGNEVHIKWSEDTEVNSILQFDIGVMPLLDTPWAKGKCAYKLIQYMACGIPVVASPIGMNCEVIKPDQNGYLSTDKDNWIECLEKLIINIDLRKKLGTEGRRDVENKYTLQINAPQYLSFIMDC